MQFRCDRYHCGKTRNDARKQAGAVVYWTAREADVEHLDEAHGNDHRTPCDTAARAGVSRGRQGGRRDILRSRQREEVAGNER